MENKFFNIALDKAANMAGKPGRLMVLLSRLAVKLHEVEWQKVNVANGKRRFLVFGRLIKAYATGQYRQVPWKTLILIVAAVIYFVNPVDLIPDLVPMLGLTDDLGILLWIYNTVNGEIDKFLAWEQSQLTS